MEVRICSVCSSHILHQSPRRWFAQISWTHKIKGVNPQGYSKLPRSYYTMWEWRVSSPLYHEFLAIFVRNFSIINLGQGLPSSWAHFSSFRHVFTLILRSKLEAQHVLIGFELQVLLAKCQSPRSIWCKILDWEAKSLKSKKEQKEHFLISTQFTLRWRRCVWKLSYLFDSPSLCFY